MAFIRERASASHAPNSSVVSGEKVDGGEEIREYDEVKGKGEKKVDGGEAISEYNKVRGKGERERREEE